MKRKAKHTMVDIAHYNYIWKMSIRMLYVCYSNLDFQFAEKVKFVWRKCIEEMKAKEIDQVANQLQDFTECKTAAELYKWMKEHTILPIEDESISEAGGLLFDSQQKDDRGLITEGSKDEGAIV